MGKLNYTARKISGIKLAQVVSKDLKKRMPPAIGSKAAARDPTLEIDVAGKDLTDDDFAIFIDDLLECIKYRDTEHTEGLAKVTEFHLQKNQLTVRSLSKLGEVIALNPGDLRELDLSNNTIRVEAPEEKKTWFDFLSAFKNCYLLKKLDLGSNPLGPGGIEVLARVYIKSELDFIEDDAVAVIGPIVNQDHDIIEDVAALRMTEDKENSPLRAGRSKKSPGKAKAARQNGHTHAASATKNYTQAELKHFACTRGLRSIPFFILPDTAMTNGSACHLASMLSFQRTSEQLLDFLPSGKTATLPDTTPESKSIIWKPNDGLMPHTKRLLEMAEILTDAKAESLSDDDEVENEGPGESNGEFDPIAQRKLQKKMDVEYTRLTKRVRMEALKLGGVHSMDTWVIALKMMTTSRALLLEDKDRAAEPSPGAGVIDAPSEFTQALAHSHSTQDLVHDKPQWWQGYNNNNNHDIPQIVVGEYPGPYKFVEMAFMAAPPICPGSEQFDKNFPALQPVSDAAAHEAKGNSNPGAESSSHKAGKGTTRASLTAHKPFRKTTWRFGLPLEFWRRIIAEAVGADGILDPQQQMQIIRYATDWNSVSYEMTIVGAEDHQQIWKFLETVNCFTYSPL
ncbi:hypothetical protein FE257_000650 [Aspergillus nanangensis]|uniref:Leucine rich repeat protein n=1 Tax=Aspergillus nanangensis TaxID=2582783 RepID=A0AAD4CEZ2_ASPNN|nr:hypothetical protein FE257_000650 [Aspergillus nanangensis]